MRYAVLRSQAHANWLSLSLCLGGLLSIALGLFALLCLVLRQSSYADYASRTVLGSLRHCRSLMRGFNMKRDTCERTPAKVKWLSRSFLA